MAGCLEPETRVREGGGGGERLLQAHLHLRDRRAVAGDGRIDVVEELRQLDGSDMHVRKTDGLALLRLVPDGQETHAAADDVDRRAGIVQGGRQGALGDFGKDRKAEAGVLVEGALAVERIGRDDGRVHLGVARSDACSGRRPSTKVPGSASE